MKSHWVSNVVLDNITTLADLFTFLLLKFIKLKDFLIFNYSKIPKNIIKNVFFFSVVTETLLV